MIMDCPAGRHGVYMLMDDTCPDHFDTNGPNILSPIKVPPMHCSNLFAKAALGHGQPRHSTQEGVCMLHHIY